MLNRIRRTAVLLACVATALVAGLDARSPSAAGAGRAVAGAAPQRVRAAGVRTTASVEPTGPLAWMAERDGQAGVCPAGWCDTVPGRVLVKLSPPSARVRQSLAASAEERVTAREAERAAALQMLSAQGVRDLQPLFPQAAPPRLRATVVDGEGQAVSVPDLTRWYVAQVAEEADVMAAAASLANAEGVAAAEPDYLRRPIGSTGLRPEPRNPQSGRVRAGSRSLAASDRDQLSSQIPPPGQDPLRHDQWHLGAVHAVEAWNYLESLGLPPGGARDIVVAVIDTGVDYTHQDLAANIWTNSREIPANGVDDDGNGYVDDVHGIDATNAGQAGNPMDDHGHGTHVAGIIAAQAGNGVGGVGIAYNVQIMALKAAQYSGVLATSDIAEAIYYAVAQGADVINMSFGGYARSQIEEDALAVAFGQAVLVAAAGNDGKPNLPCGRGRNMYPAAYNWVLGVMARTPSAAANGDFLAGFSNYDCVAHDLQEYELMAPGVDVWSTLPGDQYAAWDGTSMATPVVAGMAALVRTKFSDRDSYSSRFIMGQIATTGAILQGRTTPTAVYSYPQADALAALSTTPTPSLSYLRKWIFDAATYGAPNDADGMVDAGETVDLALVIRNHWGKADLVSVTVAPWAAGAIGPDPFVTMVTPTVEYGAVGSFAEDDNGLIYDAEGAVTGVNHPFTFTVSPTTPNEHVIPFRVTMTARNGFNPSDPTPYTFQSYFTIEVQRGRELAHIISSDLTLTKDDLWIVRDQTLIEAGVTVRIEPGTKVQFWTADPGDPYAEPAQANLQVEGQLIVQGTAEEPVDLAPSVFYPGRAVSIGEVANGRVELRYARVTNPMVSRSSGSPYIPIGIAVIDHCLFTQGLVGGVDGLYPPVVRARQITNSIFRDLGGTAYGIDIVNPVRTSLFDGVAMVLKISQSQNNVFLKNFSKLGRTSRAEAGAGVYWPAFATSLAPAERDGKTYFFTTSYSLSFDQAETFANRLGGHLVTVRSAEEAAFLGAQASGLRFRDYTGTNCGAAFAPNCLNFFVWDSAWIGLTDRDREGTFTWISGEPLTFLNWMAGQPAGGIEPNFVRLRGDGKWEHLADYWLSGGRPLSWEGSPYVLEVPGSLTQVDLDTAREAFKASRDFNTFRNNAILNVWWDPNVARWMRFVAEHFWPDIPDPRNWRFYISDNFWGTTSHTLIQAAIRDRDDDVNLPDFIHDPILTTAPETAYPFVVGVQTGGGGVPTDRVGSGPIAFTVTFNRDMDPTVQPQVSFGPDTPLTDYTVHPINGGWQDPRTWVGTFNINPITGDGYQLIRVAGARAADDPWLVTGDDAGRFRFEIITSGTEAMNLQATGGEGRVDLMWTQNDFDLLAGYNLYRATNVDGPFTRVNSSLVPADTKSFVDLSVQPGQPYFYKFAVVKTDLTESASSNVAAATPTDTVLPVIQHTPIPTALPRLAFTVAADITDNVRVASATLFYRSTGSGAGYTPLAMTRITGSRYTATINGAQVGAPGLDYYLEATDGVSTAHHGWAETPWRVVVVDRPVATAISPTRGPASGGTPVVIVGSNFKAGATVNLSGTACAPVTLDSENQLRCTTAAHYPTVLDVTVTNPDNATGTLLRGFTYEADVATISFPAATGGQGGVVQVPIHGAAISGLASALIVATFDPTQLRARRVVTGALTPGWTIVSNLTTPGRAQIALVSSSGTVTGSASLAQLEFDVLGNPGVSAPLHLDSVSLNDGAIPVTMADGTFAVDNVCDVSGRVTFWSSGAAVPGTLLTLAGNRVFTAGTDAAGAFAIGGVPRDAYALTPSKAGDASGLSAYDASFVLQHSVELITLTGSAALAADVNRSGGISPFDAFLILQHAVDLIVLPFPGAGRVWDFAPANRSYADLTGNTTGQDFTAILLGDVSGNWTPPSVGADARQRLALRPSRDGVTATATLALPDVTVEPGAERVVAVTVGPVSGVFRSVEVTITYDSAVVTPVDGSVVRGTLLGDDWLLVANTTTPGTVRLAMAGTTAVSASGELVRATFRAVGIRGTFTPLVFTRALIDEGAVVVTPVDGRVTIAAPAPTITQIAPTRGSTGGGTAVTITGAWFQPGATVTLGGVAATNVAVITDTTITAVTGAHTTSAVDVIVTNPDAQRATLAGAFTYADDEHPADRNSDMHLVIGEVTAYGAAWKRGDTWAVPPLPIPIGYVTRAGYLWRVGETYRRDVVGDYPLCWVPLSAGPDGFLSLEDIPTPRSGPWSPESSDIVRSPGASLRLRSGPAAPGAPTPISPVRRSRIGTATRQAPATYVPTVPLVVTLTVTPDGDAQTWALEETVPAGWRVSAVSADGYWDEKAGVVRWGPFFDETAQTLRYTLTPPAGVSGPQELCGTASIDGADVAVTGVRTLQRAPITRPGEPGR